MVTLIDTLNMENGYCDNRTWLYYKLVEHISACMRNSSSYNCPNIYLGIFYFEQIYLGDVLSITK